jgi:ABC-2 type transport system ATP-binding protein
MDTILKSENIVKKYHNHLALNDVSIRVPTQCIYGLLGPNGAGKTSLIRIINQITAPDAGKIIFNGKEITPADTDKIGYLPEEKGLYKKMRVGELSLYLAQLKGLSKAEAMKRLKNWFEKFEMTSWWNKKVEELSKGMQQKVQFVVTVLHEPPLLILDEPFSGFDPINANLIKEEIFRLKAQGTTIVLSTHNMSSVEELCDQIALINNSKKIMEGAVRDIRKTYRTNVYEIAFSGSAIAFANALWTNFEIITKNDEEGVNKVRVKLLNNKTVNDLLQAIIPAVNVLALNEVVPSMNDIFISKVKETELTLSSNLTE